jgi:hypothetical protein
MATLPAGGYTGANVPLRRTDEDVFNNPMQLGPTILIPEFRTMSTLVGGTALSYLGETRRDDHHAANPCVCALLDHLEDETMGDHDEGEVDLVRHFPDGGVGLDRAHHPHSRVDWVEGTGETLGEDVGEQPASDRLCIVGRADDCDGAWEEEREQRGRHSSFLVLGFGGEGGFAFTHREVDGEDTGVDGPRQLVT